MPPPKEQAPVFVEVPPEKGLALIYTASVEGYVAPCGCTAEPLGGVARLASLIDEAKRAYGESVLFVDAGNLLFERQDDNLPADACQARARTELLVSTYARKGLAATALGPLDDARGPAFRDGLMAKYKIPTVGVPSAGRELGKGALWRPGLVLQRGDVQVGVTAFSVDNAEEVEATRLALQQEADRLVKAGAEVVVVLAQAPRPLTEQVASELPGVDVVIQGRAPGELPAAPKRLGASGPVLVAAGAQAQHAGLVLLDLRERTSDGARQPLHLDDRADQKKRRAHLLQARVKQYAEQLGQMEPGARRDFIASRLQKAKDELASLDAQVAPPPPPPSLRSTSLALTRSRPVEAKAKAALDRYEASIPELVASCEAGVTCPEPKAGQAVYVGVQTCFECHDDAVKFWQRQRVKVSARDAQGNVVERTVGHSKAWQTLAEIGKDRDRSCVGCHSVGFNEPGGYCRTSEVDFRQDVQCEACHGPGSLHVEAGGDPALLQRASVPEETCRGCHQVPHIPSTQSFVYEEKLRLILGKGHGLARLNALKPR